MYNINIQKCGIFMMQSDFLNLKSRKKIFDFIYEYPGLHLRKIISELDLSGGTIRYHIKYLLEHGLILEQKKNGYNRYYVSNQINTKNKKIISYLRNEKTRSIILFFFYGVCGSLKGICKFLDHDKKEISVYLRAMLADGIIELAPVEGGEFLTGFKKYKKIIYKFSSGEKVYRLKNPYKLYDVLISLKNKYFDEGITDELLDLLDMIYKEKNNFPKTLKSSQDVIEDLEELLYEIFPNPYHI